MASKDEHRITKDTSARKNIKPSTMQSSLELNAQKAAHEAYLNSMITGYEEKIESLQAEHGTEIKNLKAHLSSIEATMLEKQRLAVKDAEANAHQEAAAQASRYMETIKSLMNDVEELQSSLKSAIAEKDKVLKVANGQNTDFLDRIDKLRKDHDKQTTSMQRKINAHPNSWIKISLECKGRKTRHYFKKYNAKLDDVANELQTDVGSHVEFWRGLGSLTTTLDGKKTLEELGIGEGSVITYRKK